MAARTILAVALAVSISASAAGRELPGERRYSCRVAHTEETSDGPSSSAWGDGSGRSYLVAIRPGEARVVAEIWGVRYSTGWMRQSPGSGAPSVRYRGTAGGRRILRPFKITVELRPSSDGGVTGTVTTYQADGGVTVTDGVECSPDRIRPTRGNRFRMPEDEESRMLTVDNLYVYRI